jgi:hypothetical protein
MAKVAALAVVLLTIATGSAQDSQSLDPIEQYSRALLPPTVSEEKIWGQINGFVSTECAAVTKAGAEELEAEEKWLYEIHRTKVTELMKTWGKAHSLMYNKDQQAEYRAWLARMSDLEFDLVFVTLFRERISACIEARRLTLGGENWLTGTWQAKCHAPTGITPDTAGRLSLQKLADGTARGIVYPGADMAGLEVEGPVGAYGSFSLRSDENRGQRVELSGRFDSSYPLRGSGTIRLHGEVAGFGTWECFGSWKSD